MIEIGMIGSTSFYNTYKIEFDKLINEHSVAHCTLSQAIEDVPLFDELLNHCNYLFFEQIHASSFDLINACLKNGKHVCIEKTSLESEQIAILQNIASEGNLICLILKDETYYQLIEPLLKEIKNPFFIELFLEYGIQNNKYLGNNLSETIAETISYLVPMIQSDIKQIAVKPAKLFSTETDFVSIRLDFSDGASVSIKLSEINNVESKKMNVYQQHAVYSIDMCNHVIEKYKKDSNHIEIIVEKDISFHFIEKKATLFLTQQKRNETASQSLLDYYLSRDISEKIIKKINSLYD